MVSGTVSFPVLLSSSNHDPPTGTYPAHLRNVVIPAINDTEFRENCASGANILRNCFSLSTCFLTLMEWRPMSRYILSFLLGLAFCAADCASASDAPAPLCTQGRSCEISGIASNQQSVHGMVSRLQTDDGRCLNISLPDDISAGLEQDGQARMTVRGDVLGYPKVHGSMDYQVDDRSVGMGECGDAVLFVETTSDVCVGEDAQCRQNGFSEEKPHANKPHKVKVVPQQ
jgi:hypothetical protein